MQNVLAWGLFLVLLDAGAQPFSWKRYTPIDGLPQSQVLSLAEDHLGYLWIGTWGGGLARFDGRSFISYTEEEGIKNNIVSRLFVDSRQNVWCATSKGLSKFDRTTFRNFDGLMNRMFQIVEYQDTIFVLDHANRLTGIVQDAVLQKPNAALANQTFSYLVAGNTTCFYLFSTSGKLYRRDQRGLTSIDISRVDSVYNFICHGDELILASATGIYSYTETGGLRLVNSAIKRPVLATNRTSNDLWYSTQSNELIRITVNNERIVETDTIKVGAMVFVGLADTEGNAWFGTNGKGLIRYYQKEFRPIGKVNDAVLSITESDGKVWVGTMNKGIQVFENDQFSKELDFSYRGDNGVNTVTHDGGGSIWFSGFTGLGKLDPKTLQTRWYTTVDGLSSNFINAIDIDASDNIWISYRDKGVGVFDGQTFKNFTSSDGLSSNITFSIKSIPHGKRVAVCSYNGLDEIKDGKVSKINIPEFNQTSVYCVDQFAEHYIVAGSAGHGICIWDLDGPARKCFSKKDGLLSGLIYFVTTDEQGYLWVGSDHGIERIKLNDNLEMEEHLTFSDANGLSEPEANLNAFFISGSKKYFGLIDGLYRYDGSGGAHESDFDVHFTKIELAGGGDLTPYSSGVTGLFKVPLNPSLPHDANSVTFKFSKVSKRFPEAVEYKFKLDGFDDKWSSQTMREVSYRNLPPGDYRFLVLARSNEGKWPTVPLAYSFTIRAPFYQTKIFLFASFVLVSAVVVGLFRYRVTRKVALELEHDTIRQQENERLRNEIARDFHDEMGNQLARIINYVGWLKINESRKAEALNGMEESAKNLIGGTRDFIWALDPSNDRVSNLFLHIRDFGEKLFAGKNIRFIATNESPSDQGLPFGFGRQINLIFKEAMTNAFKYSSASEVTLTFSGHKNFFSISLIDDGVGIPSGEFQKSGGGISNMYTRSRKLNAELLISCPHGKGTKIKLDINLKEKNHELLNQAQSHYHRG